MEIATGKQKQKKSLCIVLTAGITFSFYKNFIPYFISRGWEITAVSGKDEEIHRQVRRWGAKTITMPFIRRPSFIIDLWCFYRLLLYFLIHRFDIVHVSSPKAGLLAVIAAKLTGQKVVYSIIGRAYENYIGLKRRVYVLFDQISCFCSDIITTESQSLKEAIVGDRCCRSDQIIVGTHFDIDEKFFSKGQVSKKQAISFRGIFGFSHDQVIFLYIGRLNRDKGISELVRAFVKLNKADTGLIMVGAKDDDKNLIPSEVWEMIEKHPSIHAPGPLKDPRIAYAASDVFVCPTYRESLSVVVLEASLMGKPVITTDAIGACDSIFHGVTGIMVPKMTIQPLMVAMGRLSDDLPLREKMGCAGRDWVIKHFGNQKPTKQAHALFEDFLYEAN